MSFLTSENLPWTALDKVLHMVNTMFGVGSDVLPRSKYLFRKLWAPRTEHLVKYHYYCKGCGSSLDPSRHETSQVCTKCAMTSDLTKAKSDGCFFVTMSLQHQISHIKVKQRRCCMKIWLKLERLLKCLQMSSKT
ncbi:unnamed protein product [Ixodes persulcatus]